jgi:hypothetical protein
MGGLLFQASLHTKNDTPHESKMNNSSCRFNSPARGSAHCHIGGSLVLPLSQSGPRYREFRETPLRPQGGTIILRKEQSVNQGSLEVKSEASERSKV